MTTTKKKATGAGRPRIVAAEISERRASTNLPESLFERVLRRAEKRGGVSAYLRALIEQDLNKAS